MVRVVIKEWILISLAAAADIILIINVIHHW